VDDHPGPKSLPRRGDDQPPRAVSEWGWRYHHLGIPTSEPRAGEIYLEEHGFFVSGFQESPYGIEWMRFEADSTVSPLIQTVPHLAFEVDDMEEALEGKEILLEPTELYPGACVAMIVSNGAPVELLQFSYLDAREGRDLDGDGSMG
jgi:hypothetical protein